MILLFSSKCPHRELIWNSYFNNFPTVDKLEGQHQALWEIPEVAPRNAVSIPALVLMGTLSV